MHTTAFSFRLDPRVELSFAHHGVQHLTGYSADAFSADGELWKKLVLPSSLEQVMAGIAHAREQGHAEFDAHLRHRSGETVRTKVRLVLVRDEQGNAMRLDGFAWRDREVLPLLSQLLDELPDPVVVVAANGLIADANARMSLFGYTREQLVGQPVELLVPHAKRDAHRERRAECQFSLHPRSMGMGPFLALAATGEEIPVDISLGPLRGTDQIIAVLRDLRHQRELEQRTSESERRFRTTFEQAAVGIAHVSPAGRWVAVNAKLADITGYTVEEMLTMSPLDITLSSDVSVDLSLSEEAFAGGWANCVREKQYRRKDGRLVWVRITSALTRDARGEPEYFVNVIEDIDERRRNEEMVRHAQRLDALGRMASGIAHDFNNLLAVISSYSDALIADPNLDERSRQDATQIHKTAARGAQLTRQLLAFSRRERSEPRALDCFRQFAQLEGLLKPLLGSHVGLMWHVAEGTPPLLADESQFEQVIMNLAVNARDAMPGGGTLSLTAAPVSLAEGVRGVRAGTFVEVVVRDTGAGIPLEVLPHIFEPFFTTKGSGKGTGLGLATVQSIIEQSGGTIEVSSSEEGTAFTLRFPAGFGIDQRTEAPLPAESDRGSGECILVVEDDADVRRVLHSVLSHAGYLVTTAANGAEALFLVTQGELRIDVLVTDIDMPLLNGVELVKRLADEAPALPVLFVSSRTESLRELPPVRHAVISKPFARAALLSSLKALLKPAGGA